MPVKKLQRPEDEAGLLQQTRDIETLISQDLNEDVAD